MKTIWKFPVLSTGPSWINVPEPGEIIHVGRDPATGLAAFWAIVDTSAQSRLRVLQIVGTDHTVPDNAKPVGSYITGEFVWHLVEIEQ